MSEKRSGPFTNTEHSLWSPGEHVSFTPLEGYEVLKYNKLSYLCIKKTTYFRATLKGKYMHSFLILVFLNKIKYKILLESFFTTIFLTRYRTKIMDLIEERCAHTR